MAITVCPPVQIPAAPYLRLAKDIRRALRARSYLNPVVYDDHTCSGNMVIDIPLGELERRGSKFPFIQPDLPFLIKKCGQVGFTFCDLALRKRTLYASFVRTVS